MSVIPVPLPGARVTVDRWFPTELLLGALATLGWVAGRLVRVGSARSESSNGLPPQTTAWSHDPLCPGRKRILKAAFEELARHESISQSELLLLPVISAGPDASADLRALLIDIVGELASSRACRDGEAARVLLDYYVKRVGTHEVVMKRLCLSRPTFYRRMDRGFELVAERLDELICFAAAFGE
jgi:hypothetical protein